MPSMKKRKRKKDRPLKRAKLLLEIVLHNSRLYDYKTITQVKVAPPRGEQDIY